ncbi:MAG TPA: tetratricopeptide repeat protein, partial [Streptosporangiaceae bacterium]
MGDVSGGLRPLGQERGDHDRPGTAFLGEANIQGDVVAGNKIIQLPPEQRMLPAQLPTDISGFTGRKGVLGRLDALVAQRGPRTAVITAIHGMAGIGKTALAIHWAHQRAGLFPDGQLYADMCGHSPTAALKPAAVLGRFLRAMGVPDERVPEGEAERAALYRSVLADRRVLVILDNVASPQQVRPLLPGSRTCLTLITSRRQLSSLVAQSGAHALAIDVLSSDEAKALITTMLGTGRVTAEPKAVDLLAEQCAYLPLALRIAAAHVAMGTYESISELATELAAGDRLATLECDDDPHLAVRAAFDLSYCHLVEAERRAFRHAGLIEGADFTPQIVSALLDAPVEGVRRSLRILANAHLIEPRTSGRFRLHDLLREYARERAQAEEPPGSLESALRRLALWYADVAADHGHCLDPRRPRITPAPKAPSRDLTASLTWFEAERAGLLSVIRQGGLMRMGRVVWELADAAYDFMRLRRYDVDNIDAHRLGLAAARAEKDVAAQAHMLQHLAELHLSMGRYEEARRVGEQALRLNVHTADILHTRRLVGSAHFRTGQYAKALGVLEMDLTRSRQLADHRGEAETLTVMSMVYRDLGRPADAIDCLQRALDIHREIADSRGQAITLNRLAAMRHWWLGQYRQAADDAGRGLRALRACADRPGQAEVLYTLAFLSHKLGNSHRAVRYAQRSLAISQAIGDRLGEGRAIYALSWLLRKLGRYTRAIIFARQAIVFCREIG